MNTTAEFFNTVTADLIKEGHLNLTKHDFIFDHGFRVAGKIFYQGFNRYTDSVVIKGDDNLLYWYITNHAEVYGPLGNKLGKIVPKSVPGESSTQWVYVHHNGDQYPGDAEFFSCYDAEPSCFKRFLTEGSSSRAEKHLKEITLRYNGLTKKQSGT